MKTQLPPKWAQHPLLFGPCLLWQNDWMDQDANWYGCRPRSRPHCVRWGPSFPQRGTTAPNFDPCLVWLNSWMDQDANWYGGSPPSERGTAALHFWAHVYCGQTIAHLSYCSALAICYWLLNELPAASFGGLGSNDPKK